MLIKFLVNEATVPNRIAHFMIAHKYAERTGVDAPKPTADTILETAFDMDMNEQPNNPVQRIIKKVGKKTRTN